MDYKVVDVFTDQVTRGNPVAVVLNASTLSSAEMQSIARWTNLSETTFVVPPTSPWADYHVRIFTPTGELPFAGHPTLGTAHALLEAGLVEKKPCLVQQCSRGDINIKVDETRLLFEIDGITSEKISLDAVSGALPGLEITAQPQIVNAGPLWVVVKSRFEDARDLLNYEPDQERISKFSTTNKVSGICVFAEYPNNDIEIRTFAPVEKVPEDPVCGSGNAAVAFYRALNASYSSFQGRAIHRDGRISVDYAQSGIWIGGRCVTGVTGKINI